MAIWLLLVISLATVTLPTTTTSAATIGVTYSISNSISPHSLAEKLVSIGVPAVRLAEAEPSTIQAFRDTNVSVFLSVANDLVPQLASNRSFANHWIRLHVHRFYPRTKISTISVGNNTSPEVSPFLLQAMENLHLSLTELGIDKISVSTTFTFGELFSFASPTARLRQPAGDEIIKPILRFIDRTNSSFLINLLPTDLFKTDSLTGVKDRNWFDMMVDTVIGAMDDLGHRNVPVIVTDPGSTITEAEGKARNADARVSEIYFSDLGSESETKTIWLMVLDCCGFLAAFCLVFSYLATLVGGMTEGASASYRKARRRKQQRAIERQGQGAGKAKWVAKKVASKKRMVKRG